MDFITDLTTQTDIMTIPAFIFTIAAALVLGALFSMAIQYKQFVSKSFAVTTAILPAVVSVIIMMVNGSIGAGIAVAGSFSLVRFRSVAGSAREIAIVFISMAIGLACGMGNVVYATIFSGIIILGMFVLENTRITDLGNQTRRKTVRITVPENLDYTDIFEDVMKDFTSYHILRSAKSINLGSMFRLTYDIVFKDSYDEKEFLDEIRVRNGNLEVSCSLATPSNDEL
ncbi:DUF4956 domain-containing protein [Acidaminobacter sp. JC074]|uniref:DUF4956 domain-containing protein n=1 Tax=Acidaminobacter sp. JC074 TaxID=2530199 RepID=UPI001F0FDE1B|nr:DUF4956 domain-containing protein [Acidaminobacter sp. JC074]MCH4891411.1 DUF4956 domain-containing protein [Acidaminobacter sp. JC074]